MINASKVDFKFPINLGNDNEISLNNLTEILKNKFNNFRIKYAEAHEDDPKIRRPNIYKAKKTLNWLPKTDIEEGIDKTYSYFKEKIENGR